MPTPAGGNPVKRRSARKPKSAATGDDENMSDVDLEDNSEKVPKSIDVQGDYWHGEVQPRLQLRLQALGHSLRSSILLVWFHFFMSLRGYTRHSSCES